MALAGRKKQVFHDRLLLRKERKLNVEVVSGKYQGKTGTFWKSHGLAGRDWRWEVTIDHQEVRILPEHLKLL